MIYLLQNCFLSFTNFKQVQTEITLTLLPQDIDCHLDFGVAISASLNILQPEILQFSTVEYTAHQQINLTFNCHQVPDAVYSACVDVLTSKQILPKDTYIRLRQIDGRQELVYGSNGPSSQQDFYVIIAILVIVLIIISLAVIVFLVKKYKNNNMQQPQQCSQIMNLETFYENETAQSVSFLSDPE
ncbi:hypothetical protein SS50377_24817 [Spironucleus salmonicida]|uniref:Transmembrane protein n=1 Tax=Spironucleus salmonicida TaxID=348837 RepID=V6LVB7_9EUKA|nr:hypothetical protein SS50377_24817 [Spironucleus salmonicida]|eukprot:EST44739.1 Hypothetical protein SS50377_15359 [Spironucleus salmonicida]